MSSDEVVEASGLDEVKGRNQLLLDLHALTTGALVSYDAMTLRSVRDGLYEVRLAVTEYL